MRSGNRRTLFFAFALLGSAAFLFPLSSANAQTTTYAFVSDENVGLLHRYNADGTSAEGGSTGYAASLAGAEGIVSYGRWVIAVNHKGTESLTVYDAYNGTSVKTLATFGAGTGLAGLSLDAATGNLYVAQETVNGGQISRYSLSNLSQQANINLITASVQNTVTLASAHDVLFSGGSLYVTAGASSFKGVKKYSADLSTVTDFISNATATAAGYGNAGARTTAMTLSPDGNTFFLASAALGSNSGSSNFVGRFSSAGVSLGSGVNISNPTSGANQDQIWMPFGLEFFSGDLYLTAYHSTDGANPARVTKLDFAPAANYQSAVPTLSAFVSNATSAQGAKYVHFVTVPVPEPTTGALTVLCGLTVGLLRRRRN